jgi:signal transduction histidine kinase
VEAGIFLLAYLIWLFAGKETAIYRPLVGGLALLAPITTATLLTFWIRPNFWGALRWSWLFWGLAFLCWTVGSFLRVYAQVLLHQPLLPFSVADIFILLFYPFVFLALVFYPLPNRFVPARLRFILDSVISSGVVAVLGWLVIARPAIQSTTIADNFLFALPLIYPVADLVLLMILVNTLLTSSLARRISVFLGLALLAFFVSDYIYSYQVLIGAFQIGQMSSLGWTIGGLLFSLTTVVGTAPSAVTSVRGRSNRLPASEMTRLQNIFPLVLVLALIWFVLADWRLRGQLSAFGLWMSLLLSLMLIVRLGARAGEIELYQYWQLFASLAEPAFICDLKGKINLANPALVRESGLQEQQVFSHSLADFFGGVDLQNLLKQAAERPINTEVHLLASGAPHLLSLSPVFTDNNKPLIAGVAYNIREQKEQQRALEQAYHDLQAVSRRLEELNAQLEEKVAERTRGLQEAYQKLEEQNRLLQALDQLKSDFVSMVSHELRTPLTNLHGGLELLLARPDRRPEDRLAMQLMKSEVQRLTHFVENVLNLSALQAGRLTVHLEPVDLSLLVKDVLQSLGRLPGVERIQIAFPPDLPMVLADESFLHSVLSQLLDNALKYAPEGPIVVDATVLRNRIRVRVTDRGPGIPAEKLHLLFSRFQRLDARDSQSVYGYGLGLYLSRQLMRAQKSDLHYETPPEGGARFYFGLKVLK